MPEYERGRGWGGGEGVGCWGVAWKFARVAKWKQRANQRSKGKHGKGLKLNTQQGEEKLEVRGGRGGGGGGGGGVWVQEVKSEICPVSAIWRKLHKLWTQCSKQLGSIRPHLRRCPDDGNSSRTLVRGEHLF